MKYGIDGSFFTEWEIKRELTLKDRVRNFTRSLFFFKSDFLYYLHAKMMLSKG